MRNDLKIYFIALLALAWGGILSTAILTTTRFGVYALCPIGYEQGFGPPPYPIFFGSAYPGCFSALSYIVHWALFWIVWFVLPLGIVIWRLFKSSRTENNNVQRSQAR